MTESDVIKWAIEYALLHGIMLGPPRDCFVEGFEDFRVMVFWGPSRVKPDQLAEATIAYQPAKFGEPGYENKFRADCRAALKSWDELEAVELTR